MKKWIASLALAGLAITLLYAVEPKPAAPALDKAGHWKAYDAALKKGLPKTAISHLEPIIKETIGKKQYAEAIKAIGKKLALEGNIQGNKAQEKIRRMEAEIKKAPAEMQPVMEAILANWYWHYFQQNRWRFIQRTRTGAAPSEDFETWDLARIFTEIDKQFTKALSHQAVLKKTPVADYNELLNKGTAPDSFRPTMYDFLVYNALAFYTTGEQAGAKAQDAFELKASSPVFDSTAKFLAWDIKTTDEGNRLVKALKLHQDLLRFHQNDKDKSAFIDADLSRINLGNNKAYGEDKGARYRAALERFIGEWADHRISARGRFHLAQSLDSEGNKVKAHRIAKQGANAFPNTPGGAMCHNLVNQIEAKSSNINIERVWNNPQPDITIKYRNVDEIHFRVVAENWEAAMKRKRGNPQWLDNNERAALLRKEVIKSWSVKLPPTKDFHEAVKTIQAPKGLPQGFYYLISSHNKNFGAANNVCYYTSFWASDLSIVMRQRHGNGKIEGFVLDAISGEPVANAKIRAWFRNRNVRTEVQPTTSDANGKFAFNAIQRGYLLLASKGNQQLSTANDYYNHGNIHQPRPYDRTVFFTDRSLYRPGQIIHYKGLCYHVDQAGDNYRTIPNSFVTVSFRDRNGKEVARQQHRANDYGSFSGKFNAPRDRILGHMSLQVITGPRGSSSINVEEYKRPKFEVAVKAPEVAGKLNGEVTLSGKATAYTGAAINDAKVKWRVVREVRYPAWWGWCYWWRPMPQGKSQEIAHGTAATKPDGSFDMTFNAKPDNSVSPADEPTFRYTVYADVTDTTGETRSDNHAITLGYTALQASVAAADWQVQGKDVAINLSTTSLDGVGQRAEGTLKVYALQQPKKVERAKLINPRNVMPFRRGLFAPEFKPEPDESNVNSWELGKVVAEKGFTTDASGQASFAFALPVGAYRVMVETQDRFGKKVTARAPIQVINPKAGKLAIKVPHLLKAPKWTAQPGEEFSALWGSGYGQARAFIEVEHRRRILQSFWTERGLTQFQLKQAVNEAMRGGFTVHVTMVRENRAYLSSRQISVPWTNKNLTVKWESFRDKLQPGQKEKWTATISGKDAEKAVAEMAAVLYDESLDQFKPHAWMQQLNVFRHDYSPLSQRFENQAKGLQHLHGQWTPRPYKNTALSYRNFPREITANLYGYGYFGSRNGKMLMAGAPGGAPQMMRKAMANAAPEAAMADAAAPPMAQAGFAEASGRANDDAEDKKAKRRGEGEGGGQGGAEQTGPDLSQVAARKNLNETAFFMPHLVSNEDGEVTLEFSMPEALTKWKFMGFTHDNELRSGFLSGSTVTAKDIMVQPNPPRFVREGDQLEFTVKVSNRTEKEQTGKVRLTFADALTEDNVDELLGNVDLDKTFTVPANQSRTYSWRLTVPDDLGFLTYKAVGGTDKVTDGEAGFLPVLSRRIFVTESLPLPIRGAKTKEFKFDKLVASGKSDTLKHERFTVQMVSNPSWYAVMALPYLMESPHPSTMSTFTRLYANGLGRHIANSDPRIKQVFDQWRNTPALDSPLEKNQDLKSVMLEETPWLRQAKNESQARRNVGILFENQRLTNETQAAMRKLREMQFPDGAWPWMPGGRPSDYITLYITTGFGRMRAMDVDIDANMAIKAVNRLDDWMHRTYLRIQKHGNLEANNLSSLIAQYLYCRSFFLKDRAIAPQHRVAVEYFINQAVKKEKDGTQYFLRLSRMNQAQVAIAMNRIGKFQKKAEYDRLSKLIIASIKERSVSDDELGLFWRDLEHSHWWYRAPIETQAMMIEAFHEVTQDFDAMEDAKVWLLKQKQTQDWKTTKATADACYALLLRGANLLASEALVEVKVGDQKIEPKKVEAGTGFYEHRFLGSEVKPSYGNIQLTKHDEGVAWGSVHWQYLEDISKVTPHEDTPLKLTKQLYTKVNTAKGPELKPMQGGLKPGDELVVRLVLRTDRDMEYVHLKDQRGSGTEPTNVLSKYKYQDGLGYYQMTRDTASHFYIDYLPKGVYVFEYSVRVQHKGEYQSGMANIQCLYAPEFNSHSASHKLTVN